jgi:hypothetical protein
MSMQEGSFHGGERGRVGVLGGVVFRNRILWRLCLCLRLRLRLRLGRGGTGRRDFEQVVHAVFCEFCEALPQQGADEELGAGEVGLED